MRMSSIVLVLLSFVAAGEVHAEKGWMIVTVGLSNPTKSSSANAQTTMHIISVLQQRWGAVGVSGVHIKAMPKKIHVCIPARAFVPPPNKPNLWQRFKRLLSRKRGIVLTTGIVRELLLTPAKFSIHSVEDEGPAATIFQDLRKRKPKRVVAQVSTYHLPTNLQPHWRRDRYFVATDRAVMQAWMRSENKALRKRYKGMYRLALARERVGSVSKWRTYLLRRKAQILRKHIASVKHGISPHMNRPELRMTMTKVGRGLFSAWTKKVVGRRIAVVLDGVVHTAPVVMQQIPGGKVVLSLGGLKLNAAKSKVRLMAALYGASPLPATLSLLSTMREKKTNTPLCR